MKVYLKNINDITNKEEELAKKIFPKRFEKAKSFPLKDDYLRNIGASILLIKYLNIKNENELKFEAFGKPTIDGDIKFNYSHSGQYIALAISENEVGIDIEEIEEKNLKIKDKVFSKKELDFVNKNPLENFHILWTKKEAIFKMIGSGINVKPSSLEIGDKNNILIEKNMVFLRSFVFENYALSVANKDVDFEIELIR